MFPVIFQCIVPPHFCAGGYLHTFVQGDYKCEITGKRQNKCGNGLEVPYKYIVKGPFHMISNVEKIIKDYLSRTRK